MGAATIRTLKSVNANRSITTHLHQSSPCGEGGQPLPIHDFQTVVLEADPPAIPEITQRCVDGFRRDTRKKRDRPASGRASPAPLRLLFFQIAGPTTAAAWQRGTPDRRAQSRPDSSSARQRAAPIDDDLVDDFRALGDPGQELIALDRHRTHLSHSASSEFARTVVERSHLTEDVRGAHDVEDEFFAVDMPVGQLHPSPRDNVQTTAGVALGKHDMPGEKRTGRTCSINADTTSAPVFPKIPDRISAWRTSRRRHQSAGPRMTSRRPCLSAKLRFGRACSDGIAKARLVSAHHDEVVAMDATKTPEQWCRTDHDAYARQTAQRRLAVVRSAMDRLCEPVFAAEQEPRRGARSGRGVRAEASRLTVVAIASRP